MVLELIENGPTLRKESYIYRFRTFVNTIDSLLWVSQDWIDTRLRSGDLPLDNFPCRRLLLDKLYTKLKNPWPRPIQSKLSGQLSNLESWNNNESVHRQKRGAGCSKSSQNGHKTERINSFHSTTVDILSVNNSSSHGQKTQKSYTRWFQPVVTQNVARQYRLHHLWIARSMGRAEKQQTPNMTPTLSMEPGQRGGEDDRVEAKK